MKGIAILLLIVLCSAELNVLKREDIVKKQKEEEAKKFLESQEKIRQIKETIEKKKKKSKKIVEKALGLLTERERLSIQDVLDSDPEYIGFKANEKIQKANEEKRKCNPYETLIKPDLFENNSTSNGTQNNQTQPIIIKDKLKKCQLKEVKKITRNKCKWTKAKYVYQQPKQKFFALVDNDQERVLCPVPKAKCQKRIIKIDVNKETSDAKRAIQLIHKAKQILKENDIF